MKKVGIWTWRKLHTGRKTRRKRHDEAWKRQDGGLEEKRMRKGFDYGFKNYHLSGGCGSLPHSSTGGSKTGKKKHKLWVELRGGKNRRRGLAKTPRRIFLEKLSIGHVVYWSRLTYLCRWGGGVNAKKKSMMHKRRESGKCHKEIGIRLFGDWPRPGPGSKWLGERRG